MSPAPELAVETTGLVKHFGDTKAVDGIDLAVRAGTVYGVLGPNGAGKTTAVRMLATLLTPTAGQARVLGHDIVTEAEAVRRDVALTGQMASVDEELTGQENLVLLGRLLGFSSSLARGRADDLLDAFGLVDASDRLVKEYSGGMRRRLDIAASIVTTPRVLFLDEPTTGLDPRSRNQVWDIVRALVSAGTTVLLTTQYLEEADQLADRIAIIDHGKVIAEGTSSELKASVGSGGLRVRLRDPGRRPDAEVILARALEQDGAPRDRSRRPLRDGGHRRRQPGARRARRRRHRGGRVRLWPTEPRRGVPRPHRAPGRRPDRQRHRGGNGVSTPTATMPETAINEAAVRSAVAADLQADPVSPWSASLTFAWRAMLKIKHVPMQLFDVTVFPVMFVLLFTYLFGGALAGSTSEYLQELLPGILVMTVTMITIYTGMGLNTDLEKGIFDRFRSMPVWRPAVLVGMLMADAVRYTAASIVVLALGFVLGFRADGGFFGVPLAIGLLLVFCFAMSWMWIVLGLKAQTAENVMQMSMTILFPLTFASNVFVDPSTMPGWVQAFVKVNPITHLTDASRALMHGTDLGNSVLWVLLYSAGSWSCSPRWRCASTTPSAEPLG